MMIDIKDSTELTLAVLEKSISLGNADPLLEQLKNAAAQNNKNIEMDMKAVESMDSSAIAMLIKFVQFLSGSKRSITMRNVKPDIMQTFKVMRLTAFFKFK